MKKILTFLVFALLTSCNNQPNTLESNPTLNVKAAFTKINDFLKQQEEPSQIFKISAKKTSKIKGKQGTIISVNPADLIGENGQALGENIEVELKELTNQEQLLRANAPTTSNGQLLVSGGAYYINLTSDGQQLKLKEGKNLSVEFPQITKDEMALFYGQRDSLGQMNWVSAGQKFETVGINIGTTSEKDVTRTQIYDEGGTNSPVVTVITSEMDDIFEYIDSTTTTPEKKEIILKTIAEREKKYALVRQEQEKNAELSQKVYKAIQLGQFGWINCDRFYNVLNKTNLECVFHEKDSLVSANVYLVFKDINSVMQDSYFSFLNNKTSSIFLNIPIGAKIRLVAVATKNGKIVTHKSDLIIEENESLVLDFIETSEEQASKLFLLN